MARFGLSKRFMVALAVLLAAATGSATVYAVQPDNLVAVVPTIHVTGGTAGASLGGFQYDATNNVFYIGIFGTPKFYRFYNANTNTSDTYVDTYNEELFMRASDVPGGVSDANDTGGGLPSGMSLNPTTLVVGGITYPPGTLCFITDGGIVIKDDGLTTRQDWTKRVIRWDLRKATAATAVLPDYANAQDGIGGIIGAFGKADWNDVFTVGVTEGDMRAIGGGASVANVGRQGAFSTDGLSFYFISTADDNPGLGGVWKMDAQTGAVSRIWADPGSDNTIVEPTVLHTSVRDLTGGTGVGDQLLIDATPNGGNVGGANFLLDTGAGVTGPFPFLTEADFERSIEWNGKYLTRAEVGGADPGVNPDQVPAVTDYTSTADGTVYMQLGPTNFQATWRWDTAGRLVCIKSKAQAALFNVALGSSGAGGTTHRMQVRDVTYGTPGFTVRQVMYQQVAGKVVGGIYDFKTGDFNRDGVRNAADFALFKTAMATPIATFSSGTTPDRKFWEAPSDGATPPVALETSSPVAYEQYLRYDLNGNGLVTQKDLDILNRFMVDFDEDGDVDMTDFGHFQSCFNGPNRPYAQPSGCEDADFDLDSDVDLTDFAVFQGCFNGPNRPAACL